MDTNEQALVQVSAAALAAPSAAVAGLVAASIAANTKRTYAAALKRLDAALAGQDLTDAALLAVASDGLLRVSEVAALDVGDVQAEADGSGRLFVGASKTDQEGRGAVLYLGAPTVSRVNAWLAAAGHRDGPLFRRVRRGGRVEGDPGRRLSVNAIRRIIRRRRPRSASRAGYPVTVSALAARNRWPPAGPRLSRCRRRAGGSHRRCRATMHGASWQHGAPSLASATVAGKAGVDVVVVTLTFSVNIYRAPHSV